MLATRMSPAPLPGTGVAHGEAGEPLDREAGPAGRPAAVEVERQPHRRELRALSCAKPSKGAESAVADRSRDR